MHLKPPAASPALTQRPAAQALNVYRALLERRQCLEAAEQLPAPGITSPVSRGAAAEQEVATVQGLLPPLPRLAELLETRDVSACQVCQSVRHASVGIGRIVLPFPPG